MVAGLHQCRRLDGRTGHGGAVRDERAAGRVVDPYLWPEEVDHPCVGEGEQLSKSYGRRSGHCSVRSLPPDVQRSPRASGKQAAVGEQPGVRAQRVQGAVRSCVGSVAPCRTMV